MNPKDAKKTPLPLNRLEITIAEIMRQHYPIGLNTEEGNLWMDIMEDLAEMLGTDKPRFDSEQFYGRCFGEDWSGIGQPIEVVTL